MNPTRILLLATLLGTASAQVPTTRPIDPQKAEQARRLLLQDLRSRGVELDLERGTVAIPIQINDPPPPDPIEYLLVHHRGKKHEAVFVTEVKASLLNGALLLLGFQNGKNARVEAKEPAPTPAEIERGAPIVDVFPPEGMAIHMTAIREVEGGSKREDPIDDYLIDLATGQPVESASWIYLGGRMSPLYRGEPPVFVGDYEGNLVSSCYMSPENHLVTIRHTRGGDDHNWVINPAVCPPPGTKLTLVFHKTQPKVSAERDARLAAEAKRRAATQPASQPTSSGPQGSGK